MCYISSLVVKITLFFLIISYIFSQSHIFLKICARDAQKGEQNVNLTPTHLQISYIIIPTLYFPALIHYILSTIYFISPTLSYFQLTFLPCPESQLITHPCILTINNHFYCTTIISTSFVLITLLLTFQNKWSTAYFSLSLSIINQYMYVATGPNYSA